MAARCPTVADPATAVAKARVRSQGSCGFTWPVQCRCAFRVFVPLPSRPGCPGWEPRGKCRGVRGMGAGGWVPLRAHPSTTAPVHHATPLGCFRWQTLGSRSDRETGASPASHRKELYDKPPGRPLWSTARLPARPPIHPTPIHHATAGKHAGAEAGLVSAMRSHSAPPPRLDRQGSRCTSLAAFAARSRCASVKRAAARASRKPLHEPCGFLKKPQGAAAQASSEPLHERRGSRRAASCHDGLTPQSAPPRNFLLPLARSGPRIARAVARIAAGVSPAGAALLRRDGRGRVS